jgi:hypothetical protein
LLIALSLFFSDLAAVFFCAHFLRLSFPSFATLQYHNIFLLLLLLTPAL